jgi:hypothetical protein
MKNLAIKNATDAELAMLTAGLDELGFCSHRMRRRFRHRLKKITAELDAEFRCRWEQARMAEVVVPFPRAEEGPNTDTEALT